MRAPAATDGPVESDQSWNDNGAGEAELDLVFEPAESARHGRPILATLLILLGLGWAAACVFAAVDSAASPTLPDMLQRLGLFAAPIALLLLAWIAFGRTSRHETERFTRAVDRMRSEAESLDRVMGILSERISSNRAELSEEAARLMKLGEEASDRLGRVTHYLAREGSDLDRRAQGLEAAAAQARTDVGVLLADLPQAEHVARSFSETMRESGVVAHERALALEAQLSALAAKAQEADHNMSGGAERLGAHIARIESKAGVAAQQLDAVTTRLDGAVDQALARTTEAVDATRLALDAQAQGLHAAIDQGRARFVEAGAEASRLLTQRLGEAVATVEAIDASLVAQEQATAALVAGLGARIDDLATRVAALGETGTAEAARVSEAVRGLGEETEAVQARIAAGDEGARALIARAGEMETRGEAIGRLFGKALPPIIDEAEQRLRMAGETAESVGGPVAAIQSAAIEAAGQLGEAEASIARQHRALEALLSGIATSIGGIEERMRELTHAANSADEAANLIVKETGPELVESLVRVREAARVAAVHAREAIAQAIPEGAANLAEAAGEAVRIAVGDGVRTQIDELEAASQRAASAARRASERITRQLISLGESASALEASIEAERADREQQEHHSLSHRVALLVEALNSTAIDVAKILSNEVTDRAWAAYLKGDRGVFTRRAVRLLDTAETRIIAQHYDTEPEFREQVNRYVHDFESMLRRVLADREGEALSVTLLSSDMGKLYVALAQAIERLRR